MAALRSLRVIVPGLLVAILAGCGMEPIDTTVRTTGERGETEGQVLQVLSETYLCPHVMSPTGVVFSTRNVREGKVSNSKQDGQTSVFGPYVPCATQVPAGEGLCPTCQQPYHTPGASQVAYCSNLYIPSGKELVEQCNNRLGDFSEGRSYDCSTCNKPVENPRVTVEAVPQFACPYCNETVDPTSIHAKNQESPYRWEPGFCGKCKRYFSTDPTDVLTTLDVAEEVICGACGEPVDPSMNGCANPSCASGGVVHTIATATGPCWRCGGTKICPECGGSGSGTSDTYSSSGGAPFDCWFCYTVNADGSAASTGRCPECDDDGFATYTGELPPQFKQFEGGPEGKSVPSAQRGWKFPNKHEPPSE